MGDPATGYVSKFDLIRARMNLTKHGVGSEEAVTVFQDPGGLSAHDSKHSEAEPLSSP